MNSPEERRKSLRVSVAVDCYFNILDSPDEYIRGHTSVLKRLAAIDSIKAPAARSESQIFLSRLDQKFSLLIGILADKASTRKNYAHHAMAVDVSESGMAFAHSLSIEKGSALEIGLQLPMIDDARIMDIAGTVVHVRESPEPDAVLTHIYGVEFFDIKAKDQNDVLQWIFAQQREQIHRRRGKEG